MDDLQFAVKSVREAGALLVDYFRGQYQIREKGKDNPVTTADLAADRTLRQAFSRQFPEDGWLSEETADSSDRLNRERVWIVDPMDGTREFVQGIPEFAVSLAMARNGVAQLAVVFNPVRGELFTAERGRGARRNGATLNITSHSQLEGARVLASRSERARNVFSSIESWGHVRHVGSIAYKLALVAANEGDLTISFRPKNEWDVCAGGLIVEEAGGVLTDLSGHCLQFNQPHPIIRGVIATNPALHGLVLEWLKGRSEALLSEDDSENDPGSFKGQP